MKQPSYREWDIYGPNAWPEPIFTATSPRYDVDCDQDGYSDNGEKVDAQSLDGLRAEIDAFEDERDVA